MCSLFFFSFFFYAHIIPQLRVPVRTNTNHAEKERIMKNLLKILNLNARGKDEKLAAISVELERFQAECKQLRRDNDLLTGDVKKLKVN